MVMKTKFILATIAGLAIAATVFPHAVAAESAQTDGVHVTREVALRQLAHQMLFYNLEISPEQNQKIDALFHQVYIRVERLLSPQQFDRFHSTLKNGTGLQAAISSLQLSKVQEIQMRNLLQAVALQGTPIFTPAQRSQIEQNLEEHMDEESANPRATR